MRKLLLAATILVAWEQTSNAEECLGAKEVNARATAEVFVEQRLVAPSIAEFGRGDVEITRDGCTWTVKSYVDAQNSFGAMLRYNYIVVLHPKDAKLWEATQVLVLPR